jgi:hypothetical protein
MKHGDVEYATMSACGYCMMYFCSGLRLEPITDDLKSYYNEMEEYKQASTLHVALAKPWIKNN